MSAAQPPAPTGEPTRPVDDDPRPRRPTVEEMGEWSFPASDPPATWNWEPRAS